jgi:DNA processing protein
MGRDESLAWLVLARMPGIGGERGSRLVRHFGSAAEALAASSSWAELIGSTIAKKALALPPAWQWAAGQLAALEKHGGRLVCLTDMAYPERLAQTHSLPPVLYVLGEADLARSYIGIVGTRRASDYGLQVAYELAAELVARGIGVVSGMARGIDTAAHRGALDAGGQTVAVLGGGADRVYPPENAALHRRIRRQGAVVSEFPLGAKPETGWFPRRNRLISGLSLGIVVVEAPLRSGALITARYATEQNREVFAVPGNIFGGRSAGCHALLRDGAKLVESVEDILEEIEHVVPQKGVGKNVELSSMTSNESPAAPDISDVAAQKLWSCLEVDPCHIDILTQKIGLSVDQTLGLLLHWELDGWVQQLPGKLFGRRAGRRAV